MDSFGSFLELVKRYHLLTGIGDGLQFDQGTLMPKKGADAKGDQMALIETYKHEVLVRVGDMIPLLTRSGLTNEQETIIREMNVLALRAQALPEALVSEMAKQTARTHEAWGKAKAEKAFWPVAADFAKLVDLKRQAATAIANALGNAGATPYEALLWEYAPGASEASVSAMLDDLGEFLSALVAKIRASGKTIDIGCLNGYEDSAAFSFAKTVVGTLGFNFESGVFFAPGNHPMTCRAGTQDVRISTWFRGGNLGALLFASMHEAGHGMYEQSFAGEFADTPLGQFADIAIHEGNSRFWENMVGRSSLFWEYLFPKLQAAFPAQLHGVWFEQFYTAINAVNLNNFSRVSADEVTYNLHIIQRYMLERDLINGKISVNDLPELWNSISQKLFGIVPENDLQGVLQDIHWYGAGLFGYFPTYTMGNLMAAQMLAAIEQAGVIDSRKILQGDFSAIRTWLSENIWQHGRSYSSGELIKRATGAELSAAAFKDYIGDKFASIYEL